MIRYFVYILPTVLREFIVVEKLLGRQRKAPILASVVAPQLQDIVHFLNDSQLGLDQRLRARLQQIQLVDFHFQLLIVDRLLLIRDFRLPQLDHIVADPLVLFRDNDLVSADRSHRDQKHDQKTDQQGSVTDNQLLPLRVQSLAVISLPNLNNGVPLVSVVYCQIHLMVFLESL